MTRSEIKADKIREKYKLNKIEYNTLEDLAFAMGAFVDYKKIWGAQGRIVKAIEKSKAIIIINSDITYGPKRKFVLAHEIGHFLLHNNIRIFICDDNDFHDWNRKNREETEANEFAAELLIPQSVLRDKTSGMQPEMSLLKEIARSFGTSVTATLYQFVVNGPVPCCIVFSRNGRIEWFKESSDFNIGYINTSVDVPSQSVAHDYYKKGAKYDEKEVVLATTWYHGQNVKSDLYLYEQCHYLDSLNAVLSLLWVCEDY